LFTNRTQVASKLLIIQNLQEGRFGKAMSTGDARTNPEGNLRTVNRLILYTERN